MKIVHLALGVMFLIGSGQSRASTVEGVFLGYDGGNQVGVYRLLVEGRIVNLNRTGATTLVGGFGVFRLQVGQVLQVITSPAHPEPDSGDSASADSVKVLRSAGPDWEVAEQQMRQLLRYLSQEVADDKSPTVKFASQLDSPSRDALRLAHQVALNRPVDPQVFGIQMWTAVNSSPSRLLTIVNPVMFGGKLSLRVKLRAASTGGEIVGLEITTPDDYAELFRKRAR